MKVAIWKLVFLVCFFVSNSAYASTGDRIDALLRTMTVEQKVGQLIMGYFDGPIVTPEVADRIHRLHLGGVILYHGAGNIKSPKQVMKLVSDLQHTAKNAGELPLFVAIDQEGGRVVRITEGVTVFPGNMALGATGKPELARQAAQITARELRTLGINVNFAPVVDVNSNPLNPVIGERSFGSSPELVAAFGVAMVSAYQAEGVIATAKHFPGHGDTNIDSHIGLPVVSKPELELYTAELKPFAAMVNAGVPAVMTAHVVAPGLDDTGLPATLSPRILGILRQGMGFDGIVFTDSLTMGAIANHWGLEEAAVRAFLAGADVLLLGADKEAGTDIQERVFQALLTAVKAGEIKAERLDDSVRRILLAKHDYSILYSPYPVRSEMVQLALPEDLAVAEQIAEASITVVRDTYGTLAKIKDRKIAIVWPEEMKEKIAPLLKENRWLRPCYLPIGADSKEILKLKAKLEAQAVVIVGSYNLHRNPSWRSAIEAFDPHKTIVVAMGSPYDLMHIPKVGAYIATYGDRPPSLKALGKVLQGNLVPQGTLPVEIPGIK